MINDIKKQEMGLLNSWAFHFFIFDFLFTEHADMAYQHHNIRSFIFQFDTLGACGRLVIFKIIHVHIDSACIRGSICNEAKNADFDPIEFKNLPGHGLFDMRKHVTYKSGESLLL